MELEGNERNKEIMKKRVGKKEKRKMWRVKRERKRKKRRGC